MLLSAEVNSAIVSKAPHHKQITFIAEFCRRCERGPVLACFNVFLIVSYKVLLSHRVCS